MTYLTKVEQSVYDATNAIRGRVVWDVERGRIQKEVSARNVRLNTILANTIKRL